MNDRLQVAAMAMQGELANNASDANGISLDYYVGGALAYADALIAEEKKSRKKGIVNKADPDTESMLDDYCWKLSNSNCKNVKQQRSIIWLWERSKTDNQGRTDDTTRGV